jgi:transposase
MSRTASGYGSFTVWGLLRSSFRPAAEIVPLRSYMRQRETLVEEASTRIMRMQKALTQMNLMLHLVVTDITGATGLAIISAILAGQRDPQLLAAHRDYRCHASQAQIAAALTGNYRPEHLFALRQNFEAHQFLLKQSAECDAAIEALLETLAEKQPQPQAAPARRLRQPNNHASRFEIRAPLHRLTGGTDLSQIHSIGPRAALQLVASLVNGGYVHQCHLCEEKPETAVFSRVLFVTATFEIAH